MAIIREHWKTAGVIAVTVFLLSAVVIALLPKRYESRMVLLVKHERQALVVSPDNSANQMQSGEFAETEVNSEVALLQSEDVLKDVVLRRGLAVVPPGTVRAYDGRPSPLSMEKATSLLRHNLSISPVKKSDIIEVSYSALSPESAAGVLQQLADTYLSAHLKAHDTPGMYSFFEAQTDAYGKRLADDEQQLTKFREQNSLVALPEEKTILPARALSAQSEYEDAGVSISQYRDRIRKLKQNLASLSPRVTTEERNGLNEALVQRLTGSLLELQNNRIDLIRKFRPDDRLVRDLDKQIAETRAELDKASRLAITENSTNINQLRQETERDLIVAEAELSGLEARQQRLKALVSTYDSKMVDMAGAGVEYSQLTRQVAEDEQNYLLYAKKREEARIADSLDRQRVANVAVVQTPTLPVRPSSPHILLDLAISFLLSLFVGIAGVMVLQFMGVLSPRINSDRYEYASAVAAG